ncbi:glycosyltransferase family 4 protein [Candidatus Bathyarchaeota archaeon]|nr:MAG: glycosyltransferase family 4 protein [Candidatus Bathyarchaeota archaeon]
MNILFLADNFPPELNAIASRVYERACYWVAWGHEVAVITSVPNFPDGKVFDGYRNRWYQVESVNGIRVVRVKTFVAKNEGLVLRTLDFLSYMFSSFWAGLIEPRPDVVVATSPQFFVAVAGWAIAATRRLPFVMEIADLWPASIRAVGAIQDNTIIRILERVELFLYRRSAKVVALTPAFKDDLVKRGIPAEKVNVIINGVDLKRYYPLPPCLQLKKALNLDGCFVVGYLGTLGMAHALHCVLDAAEVIQKTHRSVRFLFVGPGAARERLVQDAKQRDLSNVIFVEAQLKERMPLYWSICQVSLVHLKNVSLFATVIPSKIFEAMGMGVPTLVAAPEGAATAIVRETGAGVVAAAEDPGELISAIVRLCEEPDRLRMLGTKALIAAPLYSREEQARRTLMTLQEVLAG